jgi:hypothetical protein
VDKSQPALAPSRLKHILVIPLVVGAATAVSCGGGDEDKEEPPQSATTQRADGERAQPQRGSGARRARARRKRRHREAERRRRRTANERSDRRATAPEGGADRQPEDTGPAGEEQPPQQKEEAPPRRRPRDEQRLERVLLNRFGGGEGEKAAWYDDVEGVEVVDGTTTIRTAIRGADAAGVAYEICTSVIGLIPGTTDVVRVRDASGKTLRKCVP